MDKKGSHAKAASRQARRAGTNTVGPGLGHQGKPATTSQTTGDRPMSIFSSIGSALKGAATGFITSGGNPLGAISGGIGGLNQPRSLRVGRQQQTLSLAPMPGSGRLMKTNQVVPNYPTPGAGFTGGGATGSWLAPSSAPTGTGYSYRRLYNKNGTPRRTKRNGEPYAIPHMNPMNPRAARRAVIRIRGARKLLQRIERSLPTRTVHRRTK